MTETTAPCATPPAAPNTTLICPACGSADLRIFYSERRSCRVTTRALATDDPTAFQGADPWPSYQADEFVDIDPDTFAVACDACHAHDLTPRLLDLDTARHEHDALLDALAALGATWTTSRASVPATPWPAMRPVRSSGTRAAATRCVSATTRPRPTPTNWPRSPPPSPATPVTWGAPASAPTIIATRGACREQHRTHPRRGGPTDHC